MKYKVVMWDLDGTLLDTLEDLADSVNASLEKYNLPTRTLEEIRNFVGNGIGKLIERAVGNNGNSDITAKTLTYFREYYALNCKNKTKVYEGLLPILEELKEKGCRLAIVSNKVDSAVKELSKEYFGDIFDISVGEMKGYPRKPEPDTMIYALEKLGETAENAVYIGDSEVDIITAKNAGIECISVSWGFRSEDILREQGAKNIINRVVDLKEYLLKDC